jgi:hypothetical protein
MNFHNTSFVGLIVPNPPYITNDNHKFLPPIADHEADQHKLDIINKQFPTEKYETVDNI